MTGKYPQYKPYSDEVWKKISELWKIYKEDVGLEGGMFFNLVQEGKSSAEIERILIEHFESPEVKSSLSAWREMRGMGGEREK